MLLTCLILIVNPLMIGQRIGSVLYLVRFHFISKQKNSQKKKNHQFQISGINPSKKNFIFINRENRNCIVNYKHSFIIS